MGVRFASVKTSHAFHSAMMEPAVPGLIAGFAKISLSPPAIPYVSNLTGAWITPREAMSPDYYAAQLRRPVQFLAGCRTLLTDPSLLLLEVGPGTSLQMMARLVAGSSSASKVVSSLSHPKERHVQRTDAIAPKPRGAFGYRVFQSIGPASTPM